MVPQLPKHLHMALVVLHLSVCLHKHQHMLVIKLHQQMLATEYHLDLHQVSILRELL